MAHRHHAPEPTYWEEHHIVPQGWQRTWTPPTVVGALDAHRGALWAPQVAVLCRTGHGNVHFYLTRFMREYERQYEARGRAATIASAIAEAKRAMRLEAYVIGSAEVRIAREAMERFTAAGGALAHLCSVDQYGQI